MTISDQERQRRLADECQRVSAEIARDLPAYAEASLLLQRAAWELRRYRALTDALLAYAAGEDADPEILPLVQRFGPKERKRTAQEAPGDEIAGVADVQHPPQEAP